MRRLILLMMAFSVALGGLRLTAEPVVGEWNTNFAESLEYAKETGLPLVVVWGNTSCSHCNNLLAALDDSESLADWISGRDVILVRKHEAYSSKNEDYLAAKAWLKTLNPQMTGFPFVGLYRQTGSDTVLVSMAFTARNGTMPVTEPAGDLAGQFVGTLISVFGAVEPEKKGDLLITTKTIAPLSQVEYRDVRLTATNAEGVCRWQPEERGYDVLTVTDADARLSATSGFVTVDGETEVALAFDFPVNGRSLRNVFVGAVTEPRLFISGADGLRVDIRPDIGDFASSGAFSSLTVKQGTDYAVFRWQGSSLSVAVLLDSTGSVRYSHTGYETTPAAQFSVLDGTEWSWSAEEGETLAGDTVLSPRALSQIPDGLELSGDGAMLGLPTAVGTGTFRVRAEDADGNVAVAAIAYAVQGGKLTPDMPDEAAASDRLFEDKVVLMWTGDETAQKYEIYRGETDSFDEAEFLGETTELTYADTTGEAEVDYCYFIRGVNGDFAGECATAWGKRASKLIIVTESLPNVTPSSTYDEQLESEGGVGVHRWEVIPNGYDVTNSAPDRTWKTSAFADVEANSECTLPFAFPINGGKAASVFVQKDAQLFFNCLDGVRASLHPLVAPLGRSVVWTTLQARSQTECVFFRWGAVDDELGNLQVMVEICADGRIRYSYDVTCAAAAEAGYIQELSTLDGAEWRWEDADFTGDCVFTPQKFGSLPDGLELSGDGTLLGVAATNVAGAVVGIRVTDGLGGSAFRSYAVRGIPEGCYAIAFEGATLSVAAVQFWKSGKVYALPVPTVQTQADRRFAGWMSSNGRRYDSGLLVFNLAAPGETVTMTAIWE